MLHMLCIKTLKQKKYDYFLGKESLACGYMTFLPYSKNNALFLVKRLYWG